MKIWLMSESLSWDNIDIPTYRAFCSACNFDMMNAVQAKRNETYLDGRTVNGVRHPPSFRYLKRSPEWMAYYLPLWNKYVQSIREKIQHV